jgi:hypothetical protein
MGEASGRSRRIAASICALAMAGVVLLPSAAFAASATFSYKKPAPNSSSTATKPKLSVYVVDRYGIRGSTSFTVIIDGHSYRPKATYRRTRDYKHVTVTYQVRTTLKVGRHSVTFKVKNIRRQTSSTTWRFTVKAPPLPLVVSMPVTIAVSDCSACHVGYPAAHPMTDCPACHGDGRPVAGVAYTSADETAHTLSCALSPCHGGGGQPHLLSSDCAACHSGVFPGIPVTHAVEAEAAHVSSSTRCTTAGCHLASLTLEHYGHTLNGVQLSCATCHSSADPRIISAIRSRSTACEGCHTLTAAHLATSSSHVMAGTCVAVGCHDASVITVHAAAGGPGCDACHGAGRTPSRDCGTCHPGDASTVHASAAVAHTAAAGTCVTGSCHVANVLTIHDAPGGPGCGACHGAGKTPSTSCSACHPGTVETVHPSLGSVHLAPASGCVGAACHAANVTTVHGAAGGPGCPACHATGVTPSLSCPACHPGDLTARHGSADAAHVAAATKCVSAVCHPANVALVHAGGPGCADCHGLGRTPSNACSSCHPTDTLANHPKVDAAHTAPAGACVSAVCHAANVTVIHSTLAATGCPACHGVGVTATVTCVACHTKNLVALHPSAGASHAAPAAVCVQAGCHVTDVAALHGVAGGPGCAACHGVGKTATLVCANCHPGDLTPRHAIAGASHAAPGGTCVQAGCHIANVAALHGVAGGPGCAACHAIGKAPSLTCATCHPGDVTSLHAIANAAHAAPGGTCVQSGCHVANVSSLHSVTGGPGCAACHTTGATPSLACATCHTGDLTSRHSFAAALHTAPTGTCVTAGCHGSDVAALHAPGLGCADCHVPGKTPSLVCTTCHAGAVLPLHPSAAASHAAAGFCIRSGCHVSDVAAVHGAAGGPGCVACHATGVVASTVCSNCHPGGFTSGHSAPSGAHTAPGGTCVKDGCHLADVVTLHGVAGGPGCLACHATGATPSLACSDCHASDTRTVHAPYIGTKHAAPSGSCVQSGCHVSSVAALHSAVGGPGCVPCHGTGATPTLDCEKCHAAFASTHPAPAAAHTAQAGQCTVSGCHGTAAAAIHTQPGGPGCVACHVEGGTPTLECAACHRDPVAPHASETTTHTANVHPCTSSNCHGGNVAAIHANSGTGCAVCHAAGPATTRACDDCHSPAWAALHAVYAQTSDYHGGRSGTGATDVGFYSNGTIKAPYTRGISLPCATCHTLAGTPNIHNLNTTINGTSVTATTGPQLGSVCVACHGGTIDDWHAGCFDCHTGGMGGPDLPTTMVGSDCSACHVHGGQGWQHGRFWMSGPTM